MVAHPHGGVQPDAVAGAGVGHPVFGAALGQGVAGQHIHDNPAVGHAGGLPDMIFNHKLEQFHQHPFGAPGKSRAALGALGHCVARRVHPGRKGRVFRKFGDLTALKFAEIHLPQIAQRNLPHAGEQDVRRFGRAQQRRGENQLDRRIGEIPLERGELGAAFVAQRQVGAGADIPAFEVAGRQAVADQVKFEVDQSMPLPEIIRIFKKITIL